jgi:hypothetical protein
MVRQTDPAFVKELSQGIGVALVFSTTTRLLLPAGFV